MTAEDVFGVVGTVVGGAYEVKAVVAQGGFSVVYRAYHSGFRAPVALKCLKLDAALGPKRQQQFLEQFRAEAEWLFKLSAALPTVVRPLAVDATTTQSGVFMPYLALEWLEGETLEAMAASRKANGNPFELSELMRLLSPVASALSQAHHFEGPDGLASIVHRDLKPENVFLVPGAIEPKAKILDFGIGKAKSVVCEMGGAASEGPEGLRAFTPAYAAPEQWAPERFGETGSFTDVWGLALTMVEVLAGHPVIAGDSAAMMGTALDPRRRPTPRAEGVRVSDEVDAVFAAALSVDPRQRTQEVSDFWTGLSDAVKRAEPVVAGGAGAAPGVIPDLEVGPESARRLPSANQEPMTVMDMDAFGVEGEAVELALDLQEGEAVSVRSGSLPKAEPAEHPAPPPESEPAVDAEAGESKSSEDGRAEASGSPAEPIAATKPPGPSQIDRAVELWHAMWDEDSPLPVQLIPGIVLSVLALLVSVSDQIYAAASDEVLYLGPLRPGWIAGLLLVAGLGLIGHRLYLRYR